MKKKLALVMTGMMLALTACGQTAETSTEDIAEISDDMTATGDGSAISAQINAEELYNQPITALIDALSSGADANKLEELGFAADYYTIMQTEGDDALSKIGFAYRDVSRDGVDELFIGELESGSIYDIFTIVDNVPTHVVSGGARDRYSVYCENSICEEYSGGAEESGWTVFNLAGNSAKLISEWSYKYDGYENPENPWFTTDNNNEWVKISLDEYNKAVSFKNSCRTELEFSPLTDKAGY